MYQVHDWSEVRRLYREGLSKQAIARRLQMSRTTVYRLLALEEPPAYERDPGASLLDPFKGAVLEMLRRDAAVPATVIREHLQRAGYGGGITILKDYLAAVRPQFKAARDYQRTSYAPGELLQADWWDTGIDVPVGKGARRRAHGLVTTLPFSAAHAVVYAHSQTTADAVPALYGCLERLGGVPRTLVVDNDTSLVVRRGRARPRPVDELAGLLGALAMGCLVLPPRRPQSKGSVERTNGYLETSFLPLRDFADLADLQAQSDAWTTEVAWARHHRRLGARVREALTVERAELAPLPERGADHRPPPRGAGEPRRLRTRRRRRLLAAAGLRRAPGRGAPLPGELAVFCEARASPATHAVTCPADVVRDAAHMAALAAARRRSDASKAGEPELPAVDLARYDALLGAPL